MSAALSSLLHHHHQHPSWSCISETLFVTDIRGPETSAKLKWLLLFFKHSYLVWNRWNTPSHTAAALFIPNRMKNCVWHLLLLRDKTTCTVSLPGLKSPNGFKVMDVSHSWLPYSFFLFFPNNSYRPECSLVMKWQHIAPTLALIRRRSLCAARSLRCSLRRLKTAFFLNYADGHRWRLYFDSSSSLFWLRLRLSLFPQTSLQHSEPLAVSALHLIFIWNMKAHGMLSSQTPCEKPAESWLDIYSFGSRGSDTEWDHSADDANLWSAASRLPPSLLFSFKSALQQAASNMGRRSNIYPCRIQLRFSLFAFSFPRSHSSKTLKPLLSFFITLSRYHKSEPVFIPTILSVIVPRGRRGGRISVTSITGWFITCPSDAAFRAARRCCSLSVWCSQHVCFSFKTGFSSPFALYQSEGSFCLSVCSLSDGGVIRESCCPSWQWDSLISACILKNRRYILWLLGGARSGGRACARRTKGLVLCSSRGFGSPSEESWLSWSSDVPSRATSRWTFVFNFWRKKEIHLVQTMHMQHFYNHHIRVCLFECWQNNVIYK